MGESQFFVRANEDAPEKGPYSPAQLAKSFEKGLLGAKAVARREDADEWRPLKDVIASVAPPKRKRRDRSQANDEHALASRRLRPGAAE